MGLSERCVSGSASRPWRRLRRDRLQTAAYVQYQTPTMVSAAILLTVRDVGIGLPSGWWVLFDAEWEDMWSVCGHIMRLYRRRTPDETRGTIAMVSKQAVRARFPTPHA